MSYYTNVYGVRANVVVSNPNKVRKIMSNYEHICDIHDGILDIFGDVEYLEDDWYEIANKLAPYITNNSIIEFSGEDDFRWGFYFKDGKWYEYKPVLITPADLGGMEEFEKLYERANGMVAPEKLSD